jgi:hypothetical protein
MPKPNLALKKQVRPFKPDKDIKKAGEVSALLDFFVTDVDGTVVRHETRKAESYLEQFMRLLMVQMLQLPETIMFPIIDTSAVTRYIANSAYTFNCNALVNDDTFGIVVGTGVGAPVITDRALGTKIAHGVGPGQLQYGAVTFGLPSDDGTTSQFTVTRVFSNGSGALITINESGLYVRGLEAFVLGTRNISPITGLLRSFCTIRDTPGAIAVGNGQALTVNYRQQAVV